MSGRLTARKVLTAEPGKHSDGGGLYLIVDAPKTVGAQPSRRWSFLFTLNGRRREMSLGKLSDVSLAEARDSAAVARRLVRAGTDPIDERRREKVASTRRKTFGELATALIEDREGGWRSEKHRDQWRASLSNYARPLFSRPVEEIDTEAVLGVLKPIWLEKPETASRLRGRIEAILNSAKAQRLRDGENPAQWRGHLEHLLPKQQKIERGHYAAMSYSDVPAFMTRLRGEVGSSPRALEFAILTAARTGEVLGARWSEIDLDAAVWTIPATRTKAGREHRIPLSRRALAILRELSAVRTGSVIFESPRGGQPLSHGALVQVLSRMAVTGATVHGFRSALRDWCGNETHFPREVAEASLAHVVGDAAERAYRRSDALEKRRALMQAWCDFADGVESAENVVVFKTG